MSDLNEVLRAISQKDLGVLGNLTREASNLRDQDGMTPLMNAILEEDVDPAIVRLLLERGADVNARDLQGWTPLHLAARDQKDRIVPILLAAGADVDPVESFGNTPLWRSVMTLRSNPAVISQLLDHGADPRRKNKRGVSPLDLARDAGLTDIVARFEGRGKQA